MTTLSEIRDKERKEIEKRKQKEQREIEDILTKTLAGENVKLMRTKEEDWSLYVYAEFTLGGYTQEDTFYWKTDESIEAFALGVKRQIGYIKELREKYPELCKQNDFIQTNRNYSKVLTLKHMGHDRQFNLEIELGDYMKLPNTTCCSCGGGDYQIKRTPIRVEEYNKNIDKTIDFFIDCITELRAKKYVSEIVTSKKEEV